MHIKTGRFRGSKLEDRLCQIYNNQVMEHELHFVCEYNIYVNCRQILYNSLNEKCAIFNTLTTTEKFIYIFWKMNGNY